MGEGRQFIKEFIDIPVDRLGVIIGSHGSIKKEIETRTGVKVYVDSSSSAVVLEFDQSSSSFDNLFKAKNVIQAIAYGFSPRRAFRLMDCLLYTSPSPRDS